MNNVKNIADMLQSMALDYKMGGIDEATFIQNLAFAASSVGAVVYDSEADTLKHIKRVNQLLSEFSIKLIKRAIVHDESKLKDPEKYLFDKYTPKLKGITYGSEKYKEFLKELKPALDNHYQRNSHHPEHYPEGVNGMCLVDLVEMYLDWQAASERHNDGDIFKSIKINKERFGLSDQLTQILINTAEKYLHGE